MPFTAHDLPGYALGLHDACLTRPNPVRLATWARLERIPAGVLVSSMPEQVEQKLAAISDMQREGRINPELAPADVLAMVSTLALTWSPVSLFFAATPADRERRRQALAETVRRAFA